MVGEQVGGQNIGTFVLKLNVKCADSSAIESAQFTANTLSDPPGDGLSYVRFELCVFQNVDAGWAMDSDVLKGVRLN